MSDDVLAYDSEYQSLVLAECLNNQQFNSLVRDTVKAELFGDRATQWFFDTITTAEIPLTKKTLKEELMKAGANKQIRKEELDRYKEVFKQVTRKVLPGESAHLKETLNKFIRTQNCKNAVLESFDLIKEGRWEEFETKITEAVASGVDILSAGHDYYAEYLERLDKRDASGEARRLPTGIPEVDTLLGGGLKNKQFGLIVGGTGRGKSVFLSWLAKVAVQFYNKTVFYFTLELPEEDIAERFDSMVCRIKPGELKDSRAAAEVELQPLAAKYAKKFFIKEFTPGSTPVSAFVTYYKNMAAQGIVADLVLIDYLDLIKPHTKYNNLNQDMDAVCIALCGFAKDCDTRIWSATQLNRSGMVNENPDESSIAGAIDKLFSVDVALFMAQNKEEREFHELRISFIKNRNGQAGKFVKILTDFGFMTFYKETLSQEEKKRDEQPSSEDSQPENLDVQLLRDD